MVNITRVVFEQLFAGTLDSLPFYYQLASLPIPSSFAMC